jgi:hypothetical protein
MEIWNRYVERQSETSSNDYILKEGNYKHLPLERKIELINKIKGFKEITVCEDQTEAYEYWKNNFNPNPDDCCNLRL